ncbi:Glycosyltransferase involved in cell wall biogenesis [Streptococcus sp. DD10]|uniref:bifunctional glycosyltransferase family 2/GtrA family protein n=1 Tax=Streptococcus sp. DD10 TaxID=1777878 RepID=UPI00079443FB|nr:bifunctional glycosyltransferase family 2/GtrA family protein [Streptococcus sp. DD10]KXT72203.1 Glycosyltransferase involved in cell wall biogenesis [Streptococcus sp. DD10]
MNYLVLPAYKPDHSLLDLLRKVDKEYFNHIVIVDDGSGINYKDIFREAEHFATVISHTTNKGKGQALKTAFAYIKRLNRPGVVVTADSDGQHSLDDIRAVASVAGNQPHRLVLGCRAFSGSVPFRSRFGNELTKKIFKLQTGIAVSDTQTGLRAFSTSLLDFMLAVDGKRYEYEMNMLLDASRELTILEVPIETIYIDDNSGSHFRPIQDGLIIYKNMFKFALSSVASFLIDYLLYVFFIFILSAVPSVLRILLANTIARTGSAIFNFSVNKNLVFQNKDSLSKTGIGYAGLVLTIFILDTMLITLFYHIFGLNLLLVKIIVGLLLFVLSWFVQKKFIFKERKIITS